MSDPSGEGLEERLARLEDAFSRFGHFIGTELRPDLSTSALADEPEDPAAAQGPKRRKDRKDRKDATKETKDTKEKDGKDNKDRLDKDYAEQQGLTYALPQKNVMKDRKDRKDRKEKDKDKDKDKEVKDTRDKDIFEDLEPIAPSFAGGPDPLEARVARLEAALAQLAYLLSPPPPGDEPAEQDE